MGEFFDWRNHHTGGPALKTITAWNFIYSVKIHHHHQLLPNGIIDNPEIIEITQDEWTGVYWPHNGYFEVFFKNEIDAMVFKLTFL